MPWSRPVWTAAPHTPDDEGPEDRLATLAALEHAPQLSLHRRLVETAAERPVTGTFIHMPVVGSLMEVAVERCALPTDVPKKG